MRANHLFVIITVALLSTMQLAAQSVTPFVQEGKQWNYKNDNTMNNGWQGTFYNKFEGDTIFNGNSYKILWRWENSANPIVMNTGCYFRQDGDKVYVAKAFGEGLFFDFGVQEGDVVELYEPLFSTDYNYSYEILKIGDTTLFTNALFEPMTIHYVKLKCEFGDEKIFYENIGEISQATIEWTHLCENLEGTILDFLCIKIDDEPVCYANDSCEFPYSWVGIEETASNSAITCYPNPFTDQLTIETALKNAVVTIFDASGRVLYSAFHEGASATINTEVLPKGMYILRVTNEGQSYNQKIIKQY